jgi:hypothetical protein
MLQAKLTVGRAGDHFEREADRVAEQVVNTPASVHAPASPLAAGTHAPTVQRMPETEDDLRVLQGPHEAFEGPLEEDEPVIRLMPQSTADEEQTRQKMPMTEEDDEALMKMPVETAEEEEAVPDMQPKSATRATPSVTPSIASNINSMRGAGTPLSPSVRTYFEPRFGADFGQVRVHTDTRAASTAKAVKARAFTVGQDVVFGASEYAPATTSGRKLLAHELSHVIQQRQTTPGFRTHSQPSIHGVLQRQPKDKPTINYARAQRHNERYAKRLKWGAQLEAFKPAWASLWDTKNYNQFADAVAAFQASQGLGANGILDARTWNRIRPIGEVIAEQPVSWEKSKEVCTIAAKERLVKGYQRATGQRLIPKSDEKTINYILQSFNLRNVEEQYRGTGAAGVLVKLGQGDFVSEREIWDKQALQPGAALQVWHSSKEYERLRKGDDIHPSGTAAVFVSYAGKNQMKVRHFDRVETWPKTRYQVWVGANLRQR